MYKYIQALLHSRTPGVLEKSNKLGNCQSDQEVVECLRTNDKCEMIRIIQQQRVVYYSCKEGNLGFTENKLLSKHVELIPLPLSPVSIFSLCFPNFSAHCVFMFIAGSVIYSKKTHTSTQSQYCTHACRCMHTCPPTQACK